jgi:hypothetical protein
VKVNFRGRRHFHVQTTMTKRAILLQFTFCPFVVLHGLVHLLYFGQSVWLARSFWPTVVKNIAPDK